MTQTFVVLIFNRHQYMRYAYRMSRIALCLGVIKLFEFQTYVDLRWSTLSGRPTIRLCFRQIALYKIDDPHTRHHGLQHRAYQTLSSVLEVRKWTDRYSKTRSLCYQLVQGHLLTYRSSAVLLLPDTLVTIYIWSSRNKVNSTILFILFNKTILLVHFITIHVSNILDLYWTD